MSRYILHITFARISFAIREYVYISVSIAIAIVGERNDKSRSIGRLQWLQEITIKYLWAVFKIGHISSDVLAFGMTLGDTIRRDFTALQGGVLHSSAVCAVVALGGSCFRTR